MSHLGAADSNYVMEKMDEIRCVCLYVCGWEIRACLRRARVSVCVREWMMRMFLANLPIQADINTIDCNWSVMCGI